MWTAAARRAASGLPTLSRALKITGGLFVFDLAYSHWRGYDALWVGNPKRKTWSWSIENDPSTKTTTTYFRSIPERPDLSYPIRVIRSKPTECEEADFDQSDLDAAVGEGWEALSVGDF
jgi:hypothetical protein